MFIVMLHLNVNENKVLDFVFIDDTNVLDRSVFEGRKYGVRVKTKVWGQSNN